MIDYKELHELLDFPPKVKIKKERTSSGVRLTLEGNNGEREVFDYTFSELLQLEFPLNKIVLLRLQSEYN